MKTIAININRPDDWHLHLRDGPMLETVVADSARHFGRALIMPNLVPPVTQVEAATGYRTRILNAAKKSGDFHNFTPIMTLYLTEATTIEDIKSASKLPWLKALKLYPHGVTTNADSGVRDISKIDPVLESMSENNLVLCVHGEVNDPNVDIFDREKVFLERILQPIRQRFPALKIVLEHITTSDGLAFVKAHPDNTAGTITAHHLMINRNHMLAGGIKPHYYCLPVAKREQHRLKLLEAAISGTSCFFLGTDSAPHKDSDKESACGCAGCYTAPCALACVAEMFHQAGQLDKLNDFVSVNGARFYGLPINRERLQLTRSDEAPPLPASRTLADGSQITIFNPGMPIPWLVEAVKPSSPDTP